MKSSQKILGFAALALLAGVAAFFVLQRGHDQDPTEGPLTTTTEPETKPEPVPQVTASQPTRDQRAQDPGRTEIVNERSGKHLPQGVKGRVVDPSGAPVANARVFLMPGQSTNLIEHLRAASAGVVYPPAARGITDELGAFALGLEQVDPTRAFDVRVVTERFVDHQVPGLHIQPNDWFDAGVLKLDAGVVVTGLVTVAGSQGLPVPGAEIAIKATGSMGANLTPTPGRERGVVVKTDPSGRYRFENAPAGIMTISAVAPNFARQERPGTHLERGPPNVVNFELPEGKLIDGIVLDAQRAPIAGARIAASAISAKAPVHEETRSGADGRFELIGLVEGPYTVSVAAPGFVTGNPGPIEAGTRGLEVTLEKQGGVKVQVYGKSGRLLHSYLVTVKLAYENSELYASSDIPPRQVRNPKDGIAVIEGLNPPQVGAKYILQVEAEGHAKAFSETFAVASGAEPPLLVVHLNEGGVLEGIVTGHGGEPLPGVSVTTLPNNLDENPFTRMFDSVIPFNITRVSVTTNAVGKFRIPLLNDGKYQLRLQHPEHFDLFLKDQEVRTGQTTTIPPIRLGRGCNVTGTVRVDGAPTGQVKVTITTVQDPTRPPVPTFSSEAITDNEGRFAIPKRVPPGRYTVMGARQTLGNPILQMSDLNKSKQEIEIGPGQDGYLVSLVFASN